MKKLAVVALMAMTMNVYAHGGHGHSHASLHPAVAHEGESHSVAKPVVTSHNVKKEKDIYMQCKRVKKVK